MSKALEAAENPLINIEAALCAKVVEALKGDHNDLQREAIILRAFREAFAHLAGDEAVVERVAEHLQSAGQKWATNDDRTPYWPMLARAVLKTLAGKE